MPDDIHDILSGFSDEVIAFLEAAGFFDLEGEYNPTEFYAGIPKKAKDEYKAASAEKNSLVWDVVKAVIVGQAIGAGISQFKKAYPVKFKPSAQDYMNRYIKEHGGEFITNTTKSDGNKLVRFIWANAREHERPLARFIDRQPWCKEILDQGKHRTATIVRTEKFRATEYGTFHTAVDNSFRTKAAIRSGKKNTRPAHKARSGIYVPIDEPLPDGEMYAGEQSINCQCRMSYGLDSSKVTKDYKTVYKSHIEEIFDERKRSKNA